MFRFFIFKDKNKSITKRIPLKVIWIFYDYFLFVGFQSEISSGSMSLWLVTRICALTDIDACYSCSSSSSFFFVFRHYFMEYHTVSLFKAYANFRVTIRFSQKQRCNFSKIYVLGTSQPVKRLVKRTFNLLFLNGNCGMFWTWLVHAPKNSIPF